VSVVGKLDDKSIGKVLSIQFTAYSLFLQLIVVRKKSMIQLLIGSQNKQVRESIAPNAAN